MSTNGIPPVDEAEWAAQERARRGADGGGADPRAAAYRHVVRALRSMPCGEPPADFAARVAAQIEVHAHGLERLLLRVLLVVFVLALPVGLVLGASMWPPGGPAQAGDTGAWMLVLLAAVSMSWITARLLEAGPGRLGRTGTG